MILRAFFAFVAATMPLSAAIAQAQPVPYEIARLLKDFPVTLYTSPNCKELCDKARDALNRRSVPFAEEQIWDEETTAKLKSLSGSNQVPVLTVGRSVLTGFVPSDYDEALSLAGYPAEGAYPPRNQTAPPPPGAVAEPAKPPPGPKPGPYDTSGLKGPAPKPGPYDPSGLKGPTPKPGPYGIPGESK